MPTIVLSQKPLTSFQKAGISFCVSNRAAGSLEAGCRTVSRAGAVDRTERWVGSLSQSDLFFEGSLGSSGGCISSRRLDCFVGHDACGELLLCLLKAGTSGAVHPVDLEEMEKRDQGWVRRKKGNRAKR